MPFSTPLPECHTVHVLEDEAPIAKLICQQLSEYGFQCRHAATGKALLGMQRSEPADLCIIDLGLPDMDGLQVLRELQEIHPCAVLILTGRNDVSDRVLGLELGADDYIVKPFEPRELVARVRSILRRYQKSVLPEPESVESGIAQFSGWRFEPSSHTLISEGGERMTLSSSEAQLLLALLRRPNRILSREQLLGERQLDPLDRSIDVRISRLRKKLGDVSQNPKIIKTVYGAGYLFCVQVEWV
jgi:two-component system, OmpR family, response regulator